MVGKASRELVSGSEHYEIYQAIKAIPSVAARWGAITNDAVATLDAAIPDSFKEMFKDPNSLLAVLGASERAEMGGLVTDFDSPSLEFAQDSMLRGAIASYSSDSDAVRGIQGLAGVIGEFQRQPQPPVYKEIPEQRERTAFALIDAELKQRLERYPKVVWQKLEVERQFKEDNEIVREIMLVRQATRRALEALVKDGKVIRKGKLVDGIYSLSNESHG